MKPHVIVEGECTFCMRSPVPLIKVTECKHKFCAYCCNQMGAVTMILDKNKGLTGRLLRCYKCRTEHRLSA